MRITTKMKIGKTDLCQSVPLIIRHDWTQTIQRMQKLLMLQEQTNPESVGFSEHYPMKALGTLSKHKLSKTWYRFSGPAVNKTMPWIDDLLFAMNELKPDAGSISFLEGEGGEHVDLKTSPAALNYVFYNTDPNAYTWLRNGDVVETHPSIVGSAWIIDTQKKHGVANTGTRYSLSIHFGVDYQTVKKWFDNQETLTFGTQCGTVV